MATIRAPLRAFQATGFRLNSTPTRSFTTVRSAAKRQAPFSRQTFLGHMRHAFQRRAQTTAAEGATGSEQSAFQKLWNSPVGPKTVHFWAPVMKWGLVIAGLSDLQRPAENLSLSQNLALMATGIIWTRWCFIIKPRNVALAAVNFLVFLVGTTQVSRIYMYRRSVSDSTITEDLQAVAEKGKEKAKAIADDPKAVVKDMAGKK